MSLSTTERCPKRRTTKLSGLQKIMMRFRLRGLFIYTYDNGLLNTASLCMVVKYDFVCQRLTILAASILTPNISTSLVKKKKVDQLILQKGSDWIDGVEEEVVANNSPWHCYPTCLHD